MFFLSNVTQGGELAFQIADNATYSQEVRYPWGLFFGRHSLLKLNKQNVRAMLDLLKMQ